MRRAVILFTLLINYLTAQFYSWPCPPFDEQHWINATFCECREGTSGDIDHFHDGVDINLAGGNPVYSVIDGTVTSIGTPGDYGINSWVRVGRYAYVHVNPNPALHVGSTVTADVTILGWTNSWNHIHFKDGNPGSEINPIRLDGGLSPLEDLYNPTVEDIRFYIDGTTTEFTSGSVYGNVDIVSKASDRTDDGPIGGNNGILKIGYEVFDSTGQVMHTFSAPFNFTQIPVTDSYIHNVYASGSNTSTYRYIVTNHLTGNNKLNVSDWPHGTYIARVVTWDAYLNVDTLERVFSVSENDITAPAPPILSSVIPSGNGFQLNWQSNSEPDLASYRLYFSYNMDEWYMFDDFDATTTQFTAQSFNSGATLYLKITALDNAPFPNESEPSEALPFRKNDVNRFLIFDEQASNPPEVFPADIAALIPGWDYGITTVKDSIPADLDLNEVDGIIFLSGRQITSSIDSSLSAKIASTPTWSLGSRSAEFLSGDSLLTQQFQSWSVWPDIKVRDSQYLEGSSGTLFENYHRTLTLTDSLQTISANTANIVLTDDQSRPVGAWQDSLLITNINWSWLGLSAQRGLINRITGTFFPTAKITPTPEIPADFSLRFYPNPFNPNGIILVHTGNQISQIELIDLLGRQLYHRSLPAQPEIQRFQIPSQPISLLPSGVYILKLSSASDPQKFVTQKMVLLK